jgi:hypothetical protein
METEKREAGLASPLLAEDHLHAGEKGEPELKLYLTILRRSRYRLRIAPGHAT